MVGNDMKKGVEESVRALLARGRPVARPEPPVSTAELVDVQVRSALETQVPRLVERCIGEVLGRCLAAVFGQPPGAPGKDPAGAGANQQAKEAGLRGPRKRCPKCSAVMRIANREQVRTGKGEPEYRCKTHGTQRPKPE